MCIWIVDESIVISFSNIYELNRKRSGLNFGIIITNTYIAPSARLLANQYQIQLLTYEDLLNTVFKVTRYLKAKCRDYEQNNKLYRAYVEIKYLRREGENSKIIKQRPKSFLFLRQLMEKALRPKGTNILCR